jgi:hypothetical protein
LEHPTNPQQELLDDRLQRLQVLALRAQGRLCEPP